MAMPDISMRQLLEAGVHFGHQTHRWNPKMAPYIFGVRNGIHILDLSQTVPFAERALRQVRDVVASGGRVLFVGTKRQASDSIADAAKRCGQYYVNHRWLGGMMTNWRTISQSITQLKALDEQLAQEDLGLTKKERLQLTRQRDKLERSLGGIRDMGGLPDILFVVDTNREEIAIREANSLGIPVVAVLDTNCDPDGITFPLPGNDDASRAIKLYCELVSSAVLDGIQAELTSQGVDVGEMDGPEAEALEGADKADKPEAAPAEEASEAPEPAEAAKTEEVPAEEPAAEEKAEAEEKPEAKKAEPEEKPAEEPVAKPAAKAASAKKAPAKKPAPAKKAAPAKKPAAKTTTTKTTTAKKPAAKTTAAKTTAAKKPAAKKPATTKAAAAKKPAAKASTTSKTAAKAAPAKKAAEK